MAAARQTEASKVGLLQLSRYLNCIVLVVALLFLFDPAAGQSVAPACDAVTVVNAEHGISGTLQYPAPYDGSMIYGDNLDCLFKIQAPRNARFVLLSFLAVDIEPPADGDSTNCAFDQLIIYDGNSTSSPLLRILCGAPGVVNVTSSGPSITIRLVSDVSDGYHGFAAVWQGSDTVQDCAPLTRILDDATSGVVQAPVPYDGQAFYSAGLCRWELRAPPGTNRIRLSILQVSMAPDTQCRTDGLYIYTDANNLQTKQILCANTSAVYESTGPLMVVEFYASTSGAYHGVLASWEAFLADTSQCTGATALQGDLIQNPIPYDGYAQYVANSSCNWALEAADGQPRVALYFDGLDLDLSPDCTTDYVSVHDGETDTEIVRFCGDTVPSEPVVSPGTSVVVRFTSDEVYEGAGFRARWNSTSIAGRCMQENYPTGVFGTIQVPIPFDNVTQYSNNMDCAWYLHVDEGLQIQITVTAIDIEDHSICYYDHISIYDVLTDTTTLLCGSSAPAHTIVSNGTDMVVRFHSDDTVVAKGFVITWQMTQPNSTLYIAPQAVSDPIPFYLTAVGKLVIGLGGLIVILAVVIIAVVFRKRRAAKHGTAVQRWLRAATGILGGPGLGQIVLATGNTNKKVSDRLKDYIRTAGGPVVNEEEEDDWQWDDYMEEQQPGGGSREAATLVAVSAMTLESSATPNEIESGRGSPRPHSRGSPRPSSVVGRLSARVSGEHRLGSPLNQRRPASGALSARTIGGVSEVLLEDSRPGTTASMANRAAFEIEELSRPSSAASNGGARGSGIKIKPM